MLSLDFNFKSILSIFILWNKYLYVLFLIMLLNIKLKSKIYWSQKVILVK